MLAEQARKFPKAQKFNPKFFGEIFDQIGRRFGSGVTGDAR
jgi:hypothetical protein